MPKRANVFIVDDEEALRVTLERLLSREGYAVKTFERGNLALDALSKETPDILITDLTMPTMDGLEVLRRVKETRPIVEVIMITAHGTIENTKTAMKLGAYDFIEKPIDSTALFKAMQNAVEKRSLVAENKQLRRQLQLSRSEDALVGISTATLEVKKLIRQVAASDVSVLIQGESGCGKEIAADILHGLSPRADKPMVKISCAAIPENLLESELFGYEKGAFTGATNSKPGKFELANGGTLFLDEIGEMSPILQAKLLRVVQDGRCQRLGGTQDIQTDVRIVSATHVDLTKAIEEKKFREDLYYRLNVVKIVMPPLRNRRDDIPVLANHFLVKHSSRMNKDVHSIAPEAMAQLTGHLWRGNVRELENKIQRAIAITTDPVIKRFDLDSIAGIPVSELESRLATGRSVTLSVGTTMAEAEEKMIAATLDHCSGNKEKAAKILGVSVRTLYRRSTGES